MNPPYYAPYQRPMEYYNPSIPSPQSMMAYQQMPQQYQPGTVQSSQPSIQPANDNILWVLNETEAMAYPVAPNNNVTLWDKNDDTIYIKSVNAQGVPSMRVLDYTERVAPNAAKTPQSGAKDIDGKFVSLDDFRALQDRFDGLQSELNELKARAKTKATKKEVSEDE